MRAADIEHVRTLPLFRDMEAANFDGLTSDALLQRFPAHVELVNEGDRPDFLHVVVEGMVELYSRREGDELGFSLLRPFSTFILAAVARDAAYLNSARTLMPSRILMIPAERVRDTIAADPAFARAIVGELAIAYRRVLKELKNRQFRPTAERLANWLLREMEPDGRMRLPFDKRKLAAHLGTTPENLSRTFAVLAQHGVDARGREIVVTDMIALKELAKPDPLIDDPQV
ncbi:MAG: helix-turn-helix domain-containing protein [Hyphomicrobiales bacterium]|nr:helix-turn-helix domain-containing protein [Hyphomicrobiales bacterium]